MTLAIFTDPTILSLYTLTSSKARALSKLPDFLTRHTKNGTLTEPTLTNRHFTDLTNRLNQLNKNVNDYATICFLWKIIGIFSGTFWIYKRLQRSLPVLIGQMKDLARKLLPRNSVSNSPPARITPTPAISNPVPKAHVPFVPTYEPALSLNQSPTSPTTPPPSPSSTPSPSNNLLSPKEKRIKRKIKLISAACELVSDAMRGHREAIKANPSVLPANIKTVLKVEQFFSKTMERLCNGEDVPLPRWFHATGPAGSRSGDPLYASITSIIKNEKLVQSRNSLYGPGTYFSSCDEWKTYGPWTFAVDETAFEGTEGYFFPAEGQPTEGFMYSSLFVRVMKDIPINTESVAYIVASADKVEELRKNVLEPLKFNVEILNREQAQTVYMFLELADTRRECPSNKWTPNRFLMYNILNYQLPDNMKNSTWPRLPNTPIQTAENV